MTTISNATTITPRKITLVHRRSQEITATQLTDARCQSSVVCIDKRRHLSFVYNIKATQLPISQMAGNVPWLCRLAGGSQLRRWAKHFISKKTIGSMRASAHTDKDYFKVSIRGLLKTPSTSNAGGCDCEASSRWRLAHASPG